jgi:CheY-like chemotaxis protein
MATSPASGKLSLLLIDDDAELCGMMQEFFAENGYRVTAVHNGREGLARALEGQYDLVILDVMLPQINGFTLLHQIRRQSAVPVIMMLAMEGEETLPPILQVAFRQAPLARKGWEAMTKLQRRNHLLGIFYYQSPEARERRTQRMVADALQRAGFD